MDNSLYKDWKKHMESAVVSELMDLQVCRNVIDCDMVFASDPLDTIRSNAQEEFLHNGFEVEMDELDMYQFRMRRQNSNCGIGHFENGALKDYLAMKAMKQERQKLNKRKKHCVFCKNNGEQTSVYQSHVLKDQLGRTTCPILRKYTCPLCKASGDWAHTIRYCPNGNGDPGPSISQLLKTERLSCGRLRYTKGF